MKIKYLQFEAKKIFNPEIVSGYPAKSMNLNLDQKYKKDFKLGGFGIYALSYKHNNVDNLIIYVGKYNGEKNNAKGGDVRDRWFKHIGTSSLLHNNLRWRSKASFFRELERAKQYFKNNSFFWKIAKNSIINLNNEELLKDVFKKDGLQLSKNRFRFALQNFFDFNKINLNNINEITNIISNFTCHYWQAFSSKDVIKETIKNHITNVEKKIIDKYKEKLPLNDEYKIDNLNNFYHYDPSKLININKNEFNIFNTFIYKNLMEELKNLNL